MQSTFKRGNRYTYTNNTASAIASGQVVVLVSGNAGFLGVALTSIAVGASGELVIGGGDERVATLAKNTGEAFTDGQKLYWTGTVLTGTASTNTYAGRSYGTQNSASTSANVILNQS